MKLVTLKCRASKLKWSQTVQMPQGPRCSRKGVCSADRDVHEQATVLLQVSEGLDVLDAIDEAFVDDNGRPLQVCARNEATLSDDKSELCRPPDRRQQNSCESPVPLCAVCSACRWLPCCQETRWSH